MEEEPPKNNRKQRCQPSVVPRLAGAIGLMLLLSVQAAETKALTKAQTKALNPATPTPQHDSTPTLRVYTNLMQVPVLVLTHDYQRMKPIDPSGFRLSLDAGPRFHSSYVRREGDDPISLAILIDASNPDNELLPQLIQPSLASRQTSSIPKTASRSTPSIAPSCARPTTPQQIQRDSPTRFKESWRHGRFVESKIKS